MRYFSHAVREIKTESFPLRVNDFVRVIPLLQLVIGTMEDLHKLYPEIIPKGQLEMRMAATEQVWNRQISRDRIL